MLIVETIRKIRLLIQRDGDSIRHTAEELGISRNTVRKAIRSQQTAFSYHRKSQPRPVLGAFVERLEKELAEDWKLAKRQRRTAIVLFFWTGRPLHERPEHRAVPRAGRRLAGLSAGDLREKWRPDHGDGAGGARPHDGPDPGAHPSGYNPDGTLPAGFRCGTVGTRRLFNADLPDEAGHRRKGLRPAPRPLRGHPHGKSEHRGSHRKTRKESFPSEGTDPEAGYGGPLRLAEEAVTVRRGKRSNIFSSHL